MKKFLALFFLVASTAMAQTPSGPNQGQITAATTNATCANQGTQVGGAVNQTVNAFTGAVGISVTGTWVATLNIVTTVDHGKTWTASGGTFSANQQSVISSVGDTDVCVFASAFTSGTAVVTFATSSVSLAGGIGASSNQVQGAGTVGVAAVGSPVLVGGVDGTGALRSVATSASGEVDVIRTNVTVIDGAGTFANFPSTGQGANINAPWVAMAATIGTGNPASVPAGNSTALVDGIAATTTQLIGLTGGQIIRMTSLILSNNSATATTARLVTGTGTNCGTGTTSVSALINLPANTTNNTVTITFPQSGFDFPAGQAACITGGAAGSISATATFSRY